jgi:hypothetical protein
LNVLRRRGLWIALCVLGLVLPAVGQDTKNKAADKAATGADKPANLKWKFEKDKPFYQTMTTSTEQNMKVMNSDVTQKQEQTFWFSWTPTGQDKDGNWTLKQKIEGVKMSINIGGQNIDYDSTKDSAATNPLADFFKNLVGSEFTLTVDKNTLKVKDISGRSEFVKKLAAANPQMEPLLNQILSDQALKEMADPTFAAVPNKEVKKGDPAWERESKLNMGPIGSYENTYKYTYEGKDEKQKNLDRIKVDTTLKYVPPADTQAGATNPLPFKIKTANLTSSDAGGTILFNEDKGRVESSDLSLTLKGELTIEIGGTTTKVDLNQKQNTKVTTSDTQPAGLKSKAS